MKRLAYIDPQTGILSIVIPVDPNADHAKAVPPGVPYQEIDDVPASRVFRDAWKLNGRSVEVDMPKARLVHLNNIRIERQPILERLDKDWMRAAGQKRQKDADAIEAKRQALRDLPATVNLEQFTTPEELEAFWPEELKQ